MPGKTISRSGKLAAGLMALLLLSAVLFSAFFIAAEEHHECTGEDCQVCVMLEQCEATLHQISSRAVTLITVILPAVFFSIASSLFVCDISGETLVSSKVRLNN